MRENDYGVTRHTPLKQVAPHQLRDASVASKLAPAGNDARRPASVIKLGSPHRAIGKVVVIAQKEDGVGGFQRLVYHPELPRSSQ